MDIIETQNAVTTFGGRSSLTEAGVDVEGRSTCGSRIVSRSRQGTVGFSVRGMVVCGVSEFHVVVSEQILISNTERPAPNSASLGEQKAQTPGLCR